MLIPQELINFRLRYVMALPDTKPRPYVTAISVEKKSGSGIKLLPVTSGGEVEVWSWYPEQESESKGSTRPFQTPGGIQPSAQNVEALNALTQ